MKAEYQTYSLKCLVCWKSVLAGLAIALITFIAILALAVAFGGVALSDGGTTAKKVISYAAGFMVIATLVGGFAGAYYSARLSKVRVDLQGSVQGVLVGALLVLLVLCHSLMALSTFGQATAQVFGVAAAGGALAAGQSTMVGEIVEDAFGDLKTKADLSTVVKGVSSRLLRQDADSAKRYLAYQAGLSEQEADQKIVQAKTTIDEALTKAREVTATTFKTTGWSLFVLIVLGLVGAALGGLVGAKCNEKRSIDIHDDDYVKGV